MITNYENDYAVYELKEDILKITFKPNILIDNNAARLIVKDRLRFQTYSDYFVICDISQIKRINARARKYLATNGSSLLKAVALISSENTSFALANYYIQINKPTVLTKVFKKVEQGEEFLEQFK